MKMFFMVTTLIFGLNNFICYASPFEEKQSVGAEEIVLISGTENVKDDKEADEAAELEDKGLTPDEIERINKIKEAIAENMPIIEAQLQEVLNMPVKMNTGEEVAISEKELMEKLKDIEIEVKLEDIQGKSTVEEDKNVSETP